ncbi:hypothetical protein IG631_05234 [Alternaria alternata]|nr:hypothetical protein IG631_05234 [Alternaria alternata]
MPEKLSRLWHITFLSLAARHEAIPTPLREVPPSESSSQSVRSDLSKMPWKPPSQSTMTLHWGVLLHFNLAGKLVSASKAIDRALALKTAI